jgi:hypothetical protein
MAILNQLFQLDDTLSPTLKTRSALAVCDQRNVGIDDADHSDQVLGAVRC